MGDISIVATNWRLVQVGRVVLIQEGPSAGRLAAIVEVIDHKRVRTRYSEREMESQRHAFGEDEQMGRYGQRD